MCVIWILYFADYIHCYMIDPGCSTYTAPGSGIIQNKVPTVVAAMNDAIKMAQIAAARALVPPTFSPELDGVFPEFFQVNDTVTRAAVSGTIRNGTLNILADF
jgi:hypothetical protein